MVSEALPFHLNIIKAVMGRNNTSKIEVVLYEYLIFRLRGTTISM